MEAIFLDAKEKTYFEEGSSSNIFFVMKDNTVVTPSLEDTILPGITRKSVLVLAREKGLKTEERRVSVREAFSKASECFVSGTAAGITSIESITHDGREAVFCARQMGEVTHALLKSLKGLQYGALADANGWMVPAGD
jgi:branched-chain amino acid aminotransferase